MTIPKTARFKVSQLNEPLRMVGEIKPPELTLFLTALPSQALSIEELEAIQLDSVPMRINAVANPEPKTP